MAINQMGFEDASLLIAALHAQVTGVNASAPVDTASFVSMAQATLQAGYDPVLNAITQVLSRTMIAVRPYSRKFKGLEMTAERWGGVIRKINFGDNAIDVGVPLDHVSDPTYSLTDGDSIDQWTVKTPKVLETRYVGQNVYESSYTIFTKQLDVAFSGPSEFAAFMSGLMTHFSNEREQYLEELSRAILCNLIGAKKILEDASVPGPHVIDLLAEYNTATGQSLTATTVKLPANYPAFAKWAYAYIQHVSEMFTERGIMYQRPLDNYMIARHTPKADQRLFMDADFLAHMTAEVLADTYHDNFLRYSEVEAVNFWQTAKDPSTVNVKPVYLNGDAEFVNALSAVSVSNVLGVLMDRDAAGYNLADDTLVASPYNAKGQYYNLFDHVRIQLQNDLTEKAVVFCIGEGGGGGGSDLKFFVPKQAVTITDAAVALSDVDFSDVTDGDKLLLYVAEEELGEFTVIETFEDGLPYWSPENGVQVIFDITSSTAATVLVRSTGPQEPIPGTYTFYICSPPA